MIKQILIMTVLLMALVSSAETPETITLCVDSRNWYPFTFTGDNIAKGIHVDTVRQAFENLGYKIMIKPYPHNRCLLNLEEGTVDGMISIAYDATLPYVEYPPDAVDAKESAWRIMQVDYMVVSYIDDDYRFSGAISELPVPIRIPRGDPLIKIFQENNLEIEIGKSDEHNFLKLIRDKKGTVITASAISELMDREPEIAGKFYVHPTPLSSQSFYFAFSSKTKLKAENKQAIWDEIAKLRDDYVYMLGVYSQY